MHSGVAGYCGLSVSVILIATALRFAPALSAQPSDADAGSVPVPTSVSAPGRTGCIVAGLGEYRIGSGDVLRIDVWKEPDASNPAATVRPDGKISVPILGDIQASGATPAELQNVLTLGYEQFIRGVRVTVIAKEINSQRIYVIGEVKKEGPVRLQAPITVLQALAEAGGITDYAKRKRIYVLRSEGQRQLRLPFNYEAVVHGNRTEQNIQVLPGDTIVVPR